MEKKSEAEGNNSILDQLNSNDISEVEKGLNYLNKNMKPNEIMKLINLNDNKGLNLYKIFFKKQNLSSAKIASLLPPVLNKISVFKGENIFVSFNECGGCLLTILFLIVAYNPKLEEKIYNFIINYLGDYNGHLIEKKSFAICANKTKEELQENENDKEYCEKLRNGNWKDYIQGMGVLFSDDTFVDKVKEDSKKVNEFVENFIKKNNAFDKNKAKELIKEIACSE